MAILYALIVGLVIWVGMWGFGVKAFDSFLIMLFLLVCASAWRIAKPFVMQQLGRS